MCSYVQKITYHITYYKVIYASVGELDARYRAASAIAQPSAKPRQRG
jgi:hypothetical protein